MQDFRTFKVNCRLAGGALLLGAALLAPGPAALAQEYPILETRQDLNGDGQAELFRLIPVEGAADLVISDTGGPDVVARRIVWSGWIGQEPTLDFAPNGSVQVVAMNEGVGRNRWEMRLTLAFRDGQYRVAGVTWSERDTLDLDAWKSCDVNMLNGRAIVEDQRGKRELRGKADPRPVTDWTENEEMPPAQCR